MDLRIIFLMAFIFLVGCKDNGGSNSIVEDNTNPAGNSEPEVQLVVDQEAQDAFVRAACARDTGRMGIIFSTKAVDVNAPDKYGKMALHCAFEARSLDVLALLNSLRGSKLDPNVVSKDGKSALSIILHSGMFEYDSNDKPLKPQPEYEVLLTYYKNQFLDEIDPAAQLDERGRTLFDWDISLNRKLFFLDVIKQQKQTPLLLNASSWVQWVERLKYRTYYQQIFLDLLEIPEFKKALKVVDYENLIYLFDYLSFNMESDRRYTEWLMSNYIEFQHMIDPNKNKCRDDGRCEGSILRSAFLDEEMGHRLLDALPFTGEGLRQVVDFDGRAACHFLGMHRSLLERIHTMGGLSPRCAEFFALGEFPEQRQTLDIFGLSPGASKYAVLGVDRKFGYAYFDLWLRESEETYSHDLIAVNFSSWPFQAELVARDFRGREGDHVSDYRQEIVFGDGRDFIFSNRWSSFIFDFEKNQAVTFYDRWEKFAEQGFVRQRDGDTRFVYDGFIEHEVKNAAGDWVCLYHGINAFDSDMAIFMHAYETQYGQCSPSGIDIWSEPNMYCTKTGNCIVSHDMKDDWPDRHYTVDIETGRRIHLPQFDGHDYFKPFQRPFREGNRQYIGGFFGRGDRGFLPDGGYNMFSENLLYLEEGSDEFKFEVGVERGLGLGTRFSWVNQYPKIRGANVVKLYHDGEAIALCRTAQPLATMKRSKGQEFLSYNESSRQLFTMSSSLSETDSNQHFFFINQCRDL